MLKICKLQWCWFKRWLNEDCISMKNEIKSTSWLCSQVLENQSRNFLLCSCCQISLSIKSFILFSKLISVCGSAIRRTKTSTIALYIFIPFATVLNNLSHVCSLWKLQRNTLQSTKESSKPKCEDPFSVQLLYIK